MSSPAFDDRDGSIWFDGELIDFRSAKIHVLSHGLHYASAVSYTHLTLPTNREV